MSRYLWAYPPQKSLRISANIIDNQISILRRRIRRSERLMAENDLPALRIMLICFEEERNRLRKIARDKTIKQSQLMLLARKAKDAMPYWLTYQL